MAETRSVVVRLSMDTAQAIRDSKQFGDEFDRAMTKAEGSSRRVDQSLDKVGSTAGRMAAGSVAALGLMGKAAIDWESQFAGVEKTVDGTVDQMAALENELRELARTMPATHQEIAATAEAAGQLGVAREDVADFTETMIQLGETTNLTADEAATSIAQMANVLGTSQDDIDNVGAALVALGNDGASTEAQILGMAQRIAGAGAQIGLAESDILAIANAAASMGIEVEAGGSSISRVFTEMAKATAQGGDDLTAFAKVAGVSAQDFARAFQNDPAQAFASFTQGLDRINKSGGDVFTTLDELGLSDVRVSQALLGMAASGDLLTDSLTLGAEAFGENTALAEEYAKRADTTAAEVQVAWNNIKDAGIEAGAALLPIISEVSDDVSAMAQAFGKLPDPVQSSVTQLLALTAIVGGAAWFGSKAIGAVTSTRTALAELAEISPRAASGLSRVARTATGLVAVASAVTLLGDAVASASGAKLDLSDLSRDLEAIANGSSSEALTRVVDDLKITGSTMNNAADYLFEAVAFVSPLSDKTGLDNAQDNIKAIDQELAALVESGNGDKARVIFEAIVAQLNGLPAGASVSQSAIDGVMDSFSSYETALGNAAVAGEDAAAAGDEVAGSVEEVGGAAGKAAVDVNELVDALSALLNPNLDLAAASDAWASGLRNLEDGLAKSNRSLRGNTDAATQNREAVRDQVSNLLDLVSAQAETGAGAKQLEGQMRRGRQAIIDAGKAANISEDDMEAYLEVLGLTPENIRTEVRALTREANANLDETQGKVDDLDRSTAKPKVEAATAAALGAILGVSDALTRLDGKTATTYVTTRTVGQSPGFGPRESADGSTVPKTGRGYADRHLYLLADGEEVISNRNGQADRNRPLLKAINAGRLADGGTAGGGRSLEDLLELAQITQNIRGLQRSLRAGGKDRLEGLNRRIAELQLELAQKELRLAQMREAREARAEAREERREQRQDLRDRRDAIAGVGDGLSFDSLVPQELTFADRMRAELDAFADQVREAGGIWDDGLQAWADDMIALATEYQATTEAIQREQERRDALAQTLNDQQQQLEALNRTMEAYAATVAGNFLTNPFGGSRTETIPGAPGPAAGALADAQAQLAAIRASATGDSPAAAAAASRLILEISRLRAAAEAEAQDTTRTVEGLDFLRETLLGDTDRATRMLEALTTLSGKGLDTTGALGGLYQQLAANGDLVTAEQLAALTAEQIDEYEKLFAAREDAAAAVGALATQEVYGQQQEQLMGLIDITNAAMAAVDATLVVLNAELTVLGEQVRAGAELGVAGLQAQLAAIQAAISAIPRQQSENDRKRRP